MNLARFTKYRPRWLLVGMTAGVVLLVGWLWMGAKQIDRERIYRIGYGTDAPFHYIGKDGMPEGLAVDLVGEAARRAGIKLRWVQESTYANVDLFVLKTILPDRQKTQHFTEPYLQTESWFVVLETSPFREVSDLRHSRISFVGYGIHRRNLARLLPSMQPLEGITSREALEKLQAGLSDAAFINEYALLPAILGSGLSARLRIIPAGDPRSIMGLSAPFEFAAVADEIRQQMRGMVEDGTIARSVGRRSLFPNLTADMVQELVQAKRRTQRLYASSGGLVVVLLITAWLAIRSRRQTVDLLRAEQALKESESKYRLAMDAVADALWDWDVVSGQVYFSPAWSNLVGGSAPAPVFESWQRRVHPDDRAQMQRSLQDHLDEKTGTWSCEHRLLGRDNAWIWVLGRGQVLTRDGERRPTRVVGTISDISRRKEAEAAVFELNRELEQRVIDRTAELKQRIAEVEHLNHELEAFSSSVSHDLRAPLRNITGFLELLTQKMGGRLDAEENRYVMTVTRETGRMGALIDDLLAFSRVGRAAMKVERVELAELVAEVRANLQPEVGARAIEWNIGALPTLEGDRALLQQVLANLLGNAVKFTRNRDVAVIEIGARPGQNDEAGRVTIFIRDNGAGFDPKYQDKLFGVFQRLHSVRDFEGTGIGLANVKRIIDRHGGRIWAEGAVDHGATFYFSMRASPIVI